MAQSQRKLAKSIGVGKTTIVKAKKTLGITNATLTDEEEEAVINEAMKTVELKESAKDKMTKISKDYVPNVRRIDTQDHSSVMDMLQDCKEQYVHNEGLIQRFQYEISNQDILMHGNANGTLSPLPQLNMLERFQKINIALRNQILQLEQEIGRVAKNDEKDNPFD